MRKPTSEVLPAPHEQILAITAGFWQSRALAVATELELADLLAAGPLHIDSRAIRAKTPLQPCFFCFARLKPWVCFHRSHPSYSPIPPPANAFAGMFPIRNGRGSARSSPLVEACTKAGADWTAVSRRARPPSIKCWDVVSGTIIAAILKLEPPSTKRCG